MTDFTRRAALALPAFLATAPIARAQGRPILLVVPFAAGGNVDAIARIVAPELSRRLERQVVVENVPGAGGVIGTERVARSTDGATFLVAVESNLAVAPFISPNTVRYDPLKDFVPVHMLATLPVLLLGRPDLPATLEGLIAEGKGRAHPFTYASSGTGTSLHLFGELLRERTGMPMEHVPYRLSPQMFPDLMAGRIDLVVTTLTNAAPLVREGRVRAYGVSSATRHPSLPDTPSFAEQAPTRDLAMEVWQGVFAPSRTDPALVARMAQELATVLALPEVRQRITDIGQSTSNLAGDALGAFLRTESARYEAVVKANNIRVD